MRYLNDVLMMMMMMGVGKYDALERLAEVPGRNDKPCPLDDEEEVAEFECRINKYKS